MQERLVLELLLIFIGLPLAFDQLLHRGYLRLLFPGMWALALWACIELARDPAFDWRQLFVVPRLDANLAVVLLRNGLACSPGARRAQARLRTAEDTGDAPAPDLHLRNPIAFAVTIIGGACFAHTYLSTGSMLLADFEHAVDGLAVFWVGQVPVSGGSEETAERVISARGAHVTALRGYASEVIRAMRAYPRCAGTTLGRSRLRAEQISALRGYQAPAIPSARSAAPPVRAQRGSSRGASVKKGEKEHSLLTRSRSPLPF